MLHRLLLTLLISFAPLVKADIGDVYFCTTTGIHDVKGGELNSYAQQRFKFKWNENSIDFGGSDSYFGDASIPIFKNYNLIETFHALTELRLTTIFFTEGRFRYVEVRNHSGLSGQKKEAKMILANCDKF
jgi:hypothetical protein